MVLAVTIALCSCNRKTIYHHYEHTSLAGWEKSDTIVFCVPPVPQSTVLHEEVELRISDRYPFMGLSLVVEHTTLPAGTTPKAGKALPAGLVRTDTLNCSLVDENGNFKVKGVGYYQYHFHLTDISVNEGDSLVVALRHAMRRETLPGIADVGIKLHAY